MLFYGHLHIDEKCKSFDCKDLKTGAVYRDFMDNISFEKTFFLRSSDSSFAGGKIYGLLKDSGKFGILVKNFNNKK